MPFIPVVRSTMSSPMNESRAGSTSNDTQETPRPASESSGIAAPSHTALAATIPLLDQTPEPDEEDEDEDEEESDGDTSSEDDFDDESIDGSSESGNSQNSETPAAPIPENDSEEEDDEDDPMIVLQVDPTTGLQTATAIASRSDRPRSSALANRLRRQHRRMTSSIRSAAATRTGTSQSSGSQPNSFATESSPSSLKRPIPVVDEETQSELRRKIMAIQRDPTVGFVDKAAMIQKLMSPHKPGGQTTNKERLADGSNGVTEDDFKTTYNNKDRGLLGCQHYQRGCKLQANCCDRWFGCRFCHDDVCDHTIVRNETKNMLCMHCKTIQPAGQSCSSCKTALAKYYCDICRFWDDDPNKNIYHCEECGICRVGQGPGKDFFHCKKCNVCIHIGIKDSHKCIERNLERDCPICGDYLFTSTITVIFMPCGHCIHSTCLDEYRKTSYQCPTCWKALGDMTLYYQRIDELLAEETMPPEYANIVSIILCNDCEVRSETPYHFLYHKCDKCKGYNTRVLEFKRLSDGKMEAVEDATAAARTVGAAGTAPEGNVSRGSTIVAGPSSSSSSSSSSPSSGSSSATMPVLHFPRVPRPSLMYSEDSSLGEQHESSENSAP